MNREIIKAVFGNELLDRIDKGQCPTCGKPIGPFRSELCKREYKISGMCQACQDKLFGSDE